MNGSCSYIKTFHDIYRTKFWEKFNVKLIFQSSPAHLLLCSYPLSVGGFFVALHADGMELHDALGEGDEVQDVSKRLQKSAKGSRKVVSITA